MKSVFVLLTALFFSSIPLIAQSDDEYPFNENHKGAFGYSMSYDAYKFEFAQSGYEKATNFSLGFYYKRTINTDLELRLGFIVSERGYKHVQNFGVSSFEYRVWAAYVDLSAAIGYRYILNKNIVLVPSGGFIFGIPTYKSVTSDDTDPDEFVIEYLTNDFESNGGLSIQLAAELHLGSRFFIQFEPYYRKWFGNFNETTFVETPSSYGVGSGLFYKF